MRATIDGAGRIVVPKALRDALGLTPGQTLDLTVADGRLEAEPLAVSMRLERRGETYTAVPDEPLPPLSAELVRETLENVRR
jgi:AbrB family looped-hinge helix DNA binding protein